MDFLIQVVKGEKKGILAQVILALLAIMEGIYFFLLKLRFWLFKTGLLASKNLTARVISIGNISVGGTGKTPLVAYLARKLQEKGKRVVILSRGYKGDNAEPLVVSRGKGPEIGVHKAGDEALMLSSMLPDIPLVIGKNRWAAGQLAERLFKPDFLLLDDGFQHLGLKRDLDLVIIDGLNPFGYGHLLPRGFLREPLSSLKRADLFLISRSEHLSEGEIWKIKEKLREINALAPVFRASYQAAYLREAGEKAKYLSLSLLKDRKIMALAGIGNPESFVLTLSKLGAKVLELAAFPDHHQYQLADMENLADQAVNKGLKWIITTEKDIVKLCPEYLQPIAAAGCKMLVLGIELKIAEEDAFLELITV